MEWIIRRRSKRIPAMHLLRRRVFIPYVKTGHNWLLVTEYYCEILMVMNFGPYNKQQHTSCWAIELKCMICRLDAVNLSSIILESTVGREEQHDFLCIALLHRPQGEYR